MNFMTNTLTFTNKTKISSKPLLSRGVQCILTECNVVFLSRSVSCVVTYYLTTQQRLQGPPTVYIPNYTCTGLVNTMRFL